MSMLLGDVGLIKSIEMDRFLPVTSAKKLEEIVFEFFCVLVDKLSGILANDL